MQEPERPLGLGILAVMSFGFALWNIQSGAMLVLLLAGKLSMPEAPELVAAYQSLPGWFRVMALTAAALKAGLLVGAGICYFARRRLGRLLGSSYAVVSIAESVVAGVTFGSFGGDAIIGILFAVFTLVAVNTMYRPHLTR